MTEQVYIPSLSNSQSPWQRLHEVSIGRPQGIERSDPFDDIRDEARNPNNYRGIPNTNIKNLIVENTQFMSAYYSLAQRALNGGLENRAPEGIKLSDQEIYSLRFMINVNSIGMGVDHLDLTRGPVIANERERRNIRQETMVNLTAQLSSSITMDRSSTEDTADAILELKESASPQDIRAFANEQASEWGGKLATERAAEEAEIVRMSQSMMFVP